MCVVGSGSRRWSRGSSRIRIRAMPPPSESHYLLTGVNIAPAFRNPLPSTCDLRADGVNGQAEPDELDLVARGTGLKGGEHALAVEPGAGRDGGGHLLRWRRRRQAQPLGQDTAQVTGEQGGRLLTVSRPLQQVSDGDHQLGSWDANRPRLRDRAPEPAATPQREL